MSWFHEYSRVFDESVKKLVELFLILLSTITKKCRLLTIDMRQSNCKYKMKYIHTRDMSQKCVCELQYLICIVHCSYP